MMGDAPVVAHCSKVFAAGWTYLISTETTSLIFLLCSLQSMTAGKPFFLVKLSCPETNFTTSVVVQVRVFTVALFLSIIYK